MRKAKELKECPIFKEMMIDGKNYLINQLVTTKPEELQLREFIFSKIKGLETIDLIIQDIINRNTTKG